MTILYFLRALSELGVYYTLAGTAAALFGGQLQLEGTAPPPQAEPHGTGG